MYPCLPLYAALPSRCNLRPLKNAAVTVILCRGEATEVAVAAILYVQKRVGREFERLSGRYSALQPAVTAVAKSLLTS